MSRILIDGRFVGVGESIGRYTLELLSHILELDKKNSYTLLIRPAGVDACGGSFDIKKLEPGNLIRNSELEIRNLQIKVLDIKHYSLNEQVGLLKFLKKEHYDLVHFPQFNHPIRYRGKFVVTIHDLILLNHAKANFVKRAAFLPVLKSAARDSAAIITASEETKREIIYTLRGREEKINLIYHGIDHSKFNITAKSHRELLDKFCQKNKIENDYLLYVGAWKSHKNLSRLLAAYEKYVFENEKFVQLVLVGKIDRKEKTLLKEIARINSRAMKQWSNEAIVTSGPVGSDDELAAIYAGAIAYVIPSLAEGFGWPPLEAMACGTPVISSKVSCMPEILGDAALYFDPLNVDDITGAIKKIISDHSLRQKLIKSGLEQVKKYDWAETAKQTLEVYNSVLSI